MDLSFTEQQEMLRKTARDFLEKECPWQSVEELQKSEKGYSPETWRRIADLGWLGTAIPAAYGGTGGSLVDLSILFEEMGRVLLPSPFQSTVLCALAIAEFGAEQQKKVFLPKIANGERIMGACITEASGRYEPQYIKLPAKLVEPNYVLNGAKLFCRDAHIADWLIVPARTSESKNPELGLTTFLVDGANFGMSYRVLKTIGNDRESQVTFNEVRAFKANVLGEKDKGWPVAKRMVQYGALLECCEMLGAARKVLEMTVAYAKDRVQFGRPIGTFQAIQHKCADMATDVDTARLITYYALWKAVEGLPCEAEISQAKTWVSEAFRRVAREGHQIHAGIAFILEHPLHLYFARAKAGELHYGNPDFHRRAIAASLLD